jgi:hypothetical protein
MNSKIIKIIIYTIILLLYYKISLTQNYVTLHGDKFMLNGEEFFPLVMNYSIDVEGSPDNYYISPHTSYCDKYDYANDKWYCGTEQQCSTKIDNDLDKIKSWGFNAIRLNGGFEVTLTDGNPDLHFGYDDDGDLEGPYDEHFDLIEQVLDIVSTHDLKVIFDLGKYGNKDPDSYAYYLGELAERFKDNTTIMAYDLYNEPSFWDKDDYTKYTTCSMVSDWYYAIKNNSPNHLVTIGLQKTVAVLEWDPHFMTVDFLSFHPYPKNNYIEETIVSEIISSEVMWYSKVIQKPWIIGETGLYASDYIPDEDECKSIVFSESDQKDYANLSLYTCADCGSSGYSWWQYQEVHHNTGEPGDLRHCTQNYFGLITRTNPEDPGNENVKQAVTVFDNFIYNPSTCNINENVYYNRYGYDGYHVTGQVEDENSNPIPDAYVRGKFEYNDEYPWSITFSKSVEDDGTLDVSSPDDDIPIEWLIISAPGYDTYYYHKDGGIDIEINAELRRITYNENETVNEDIEIDDEPENVYAVNSITVNDITVEGNGSTGGSLKLRAENSIIFNTGFIAEKGSHVDAFSGVYCKCEAIPAELRTKSTSYYEKKYPKPEENNSKSISVFPNPTKGIIKINSSFTFLDRVSIYDQTGHLIYNNNNLSGNYEIALSPKYKGIYYLVIIAGDQFVKEKIVLE